MKRYSLLLLLVSIFVFGSCDQSTSIPSSGEEGNSASLTSSVSTKIPLLKSAKQDSLIPGQYIVVFRETVGNVQASAEELTDELAGNLLRTYKYAIKGFLAGNLSTNAVEGLKNNPNVKFIEQDRFRIVTDVDQSNPPLGA